MTWNSGREGGSETDLKAAEETEQNSQDLPAPERIWQTQGSEAGSKLGSGPRQ